MSREMIEQTEQCLHEGCGMCGESLLEMAKPARQVTRELRSHLSQSRYPQPKQGVLKDYGE